MNIKRKIIATIVSVFMVANLLLAFAGCGACEHEWGKFKTVNTATCTERGVKERTCELCGEVDTITFDTIAHKWQSATCTEPKTCKTCLATEGEARGHIYAKKSILDKALKTPATNEDTNAVYYKSCSCGAVSDADSDTFIVKTMTGKNILIFGDSYSSYKGNIPDGYRVYYDGTNILNNPNQMWYNLLVKERGGNIVRNDSSSGSTINTAGYHPFIDRLNTLYNQGFFTRNKIDYVYVLGGTNDNGSNDLGEEKYSDWSNGDLTQVLPAICYFFCRLREILPDAEIYGLVNSPKLKLAISNAIVNACEYIDGKSVVLKDIDLSSGHPTSVGMNQIKTQVLAVFDM